MYCGIISRKAECSAQVPPGSGVGEAARGLLLQAGSLVVGGILCLEIVGLRSPFPSWFSAMWPPEAADPWFFAFSGARSKGSQDSVWLIPGTSLSINSRLTD